MCGAELAVLLSVTSDTERDAFPECNRGPRPSLWRGEGGRGGHVSQREEGKPVTDWAHEDPMSRQEEG
ncbi:hypothetical protein CgunFtcFv8_006080 [Champsocephalus gunnari]|uniref:Uncharacterized protein n=1 Tax=Champsocephalus gunnari TaxID=52237 RepID=A0AAN8GYY4_CHAGU|nr:hypothetical protein CgunFtcFv8_006080 [Champsocephalus gunnari]